MSMITYITVLSYDTAYMIRKWCSNRHFEIRIECLNEYAYASDRSYVFSLYNKNDVTLFLLRWGNEVSHIYSAHTTPLLNVLEETSTMKIPLM